jgi:ABC-type polysaccharide/polyol phosphate transport system ATPase subunit
MHNRDFAIKLTDISKKYEIHHEKPTLVEKFTKRRNEIFWALKDVNLTIKKGDRIGIVGPNGSGKTTLLKIITGITTPTTGSVETNGKIVSLIDLNAGFHADLSGYQNIFLNGMLLGLSNRQIIGRIGDIIQFADIRQFIDTPLYTYSSGMMLRLGFAIAAFSDPEIIIMDEGVSTGDEKFQKKVLEWIDGFINSGHTLILASHQKEIISSLCTKIIKVYCGQIT